MTSDVTLLAAFGAGLVSFLSPCVLPIVPGYLSLITGLDIADLEQGRSDHLWRIARNTGLFVLGFGSVFVAMGVSASALGGVLFENQVLLTRISGVIILAMALFILGSLFVQAPWLYQEARFHPNLARYGPAAAPVAGAAFGFGWTPCIGPVLTSVLAIAASDGRESRGALLLAVYSLGLGLPFLLTGLAMGRLTGAMSWVKRHFVVITAVSAGFLAVFGVILIFDQMSWLTGRIKDGFESVGLDRLVDLG
ncbi:MAG: cytochrome c biogenesis CcdA family protein [Acidimicrobiales bacterium]